MISIDKDGYLDLTKLHPNQKEFVTSNKLHTGIVGGYQSGKSAAASIKVITKLLIDPEVPIAYYLPNYRLISDMLVPKFKSLFDMIDIDYVHNKQESKLTTDYGEIWMRSMDNPDSIISYSVGYSLVDEADLVHSNRREEVMQRISSRNSYKKSTPNCMDFVSTPEGFGYMYNFFVKKQNDSKLLLRLSTLDNKENLGEGYIEGLISMYTENQLKAYLDGKFVNLKSGTVYNEYDRNRNFTDRAIKFGEVLHIGMDFNITNMNAVIHVIDGTVYKAVAEVTGAYDTNDMSRIIKERFPGHYIVIYPDASGQNRHSSGVSDIQLLKSYRFNIKVLRKNPFVKDRVNNMNNLFQKGKYLVNYDNCPAYADALEQLSYKNGEPDKTSGLDHITDAGGYFAWSKNKSKHTRAVV